MSQLVKTKRQDKFKDFKRFGAFNGLVEQKNIVFNSFVCKLGFFWHSLNKLLIIVALYTITGILLYNKFKIYGIKHFSLSSEYVSNCMTFACSLKLVATELPDKKNVENRTVQYCRICCCNSHPTLLWRTFYLCLCRIWTWYRIKPPYITAPDVVSLLL
jgi:hypothetical protein